MPEHLTAAEEAIPLDSVMYLRDGAPHATVCRLVMKDGRIGIGVYRATAGVLPIDQHEADTLALGDALLHLHDRPVCDKCSANPPNHRVGDRQLCCSCYVGEGHPPADWHIECMRVAGQASDPDDLQASLGQPAR